MKKRKIEIIEQVTSQGADLSFKLNGKNIHISDLLDKLSVRHAYQLEYS